MPENKPEVVTTSWGRVDTPFGSFRDAKLWPGGGRAWDWSETGTHHSPGVQQSDISAIIDHGVEVVVIGRGRQTRLGVTEEVRTAARLAGIRIEDAETTEAVRRYNKLVAEGVAVGALIHSTC